MDPLSEVELKDIAGRIGCVFDDVLCRYDGAKYPERPYQQMVASFAQRSPQNSEIESAMKWKWGHWGKANFPEHHKRLIALITNTWPKYTETDCLSPRDTFSFWLKELKKPHRYILVAFLTHLVHATEVPIIDQHNYRAMLFLLRATNRTPDVKKKPSNWRDIEDLGAFLSSLSHHMGKSKRELDKFLMMYGRYRVPR